MTDNLYTRRRCHRHDTLLDRDTGCCDCERDARLDCTECGGEGYIYTRHPRHGRPDCPDPYLETPCKTCQGGGHQ